MVLSFGFGWALLSKKLPLLEKPVWRWVSAAALSFCTLASLIIPGAASFGPGYTTSPFWHFKGIRVNQSVIQSADYISIYRQQTNQQPTFISSPLAGFIYLITATTNPTAFDHPLAFDFGLNGQQEVINFVEEGKIRYICLSLLTDNNPLRPKQVEDYVLNRMQLVSNVGFCRLYQRPGQ